MSRPDEVKSGEGEQAPNGLSSSQVAALARKHNGFFEARAGDAGPATGSGDAAEVSK